RDDYSISLCTPAELMRHMAHMNNGSGSRSCRHQVFETALVDQSLYLLAASQPMEKQTAPGIRYSPQAATDVMKSSADRHRASSSVYRAAGSCSPPTASQIAHR